MPQCLQPIRIVRVGCQPQDVRRPASAFVDLVPQLLSLPGALGCSPETMQYLRRLTAHDPEEARNRADFEQSEVSYSNARGAFMDVFNAISVETSAVIEIEDGQWLDPTIETIDRRAQQLDCSRRILFILTSRTCVLAGERIRELILRPLQSVGGHDGSEGAHGTGKANQQRLSRLVCLLFGRQSLLSDRTSSKWH